MAKKKVQKRSAKGFADVLIGLQYGDEGKARIVDMLAKDYDVIARFNGGANAGHTIETKDGGKVALQQVPSGIFYPKKILYIGSGCVVNVEKLAIEIEKLENIKGVKVDLTNRLRISCQASVIQPHHLLIDAETGKTIGTTKNGIGPCYADKALRMDGERLLNIKLGDLLDDPQEYFKKIKANYLAVCGKYGIDHAHADNIIATMESFFNRIKEYIEPDTLFLEKKVQKGAKILFEGAQSIMLDITKGSVPYVTSSNTVTAAAYVGGDLSPNYHRKTIGVAKAIMSRVGYGPFASEFGGERSEKYCMATEGGKSKHPQPVEAKYDIEKLLKSGDYFDIGVALRVLSHEYGTVTARPRRVGILDLVQLAYAIRMNGVDELMINKCDMLNVFARTKRGVLPIVNGYTLDGREIDYVPGTVKAYYSVKAKVEYKKCFDSDVSGVRKFGKLPKELQGLLREIESFCGCKIAGVGVGPEREQFVKV
ncbi:adenylosuccinate synthetase [Candidatus Peregrinibacteria bacterium]|nr:adenylosuccinate synthetase [Candidatus Peregrinibacteria bacterium]